MDELGPMNGPNVWEHCPYGYCSLPEGCICEYIPKENMTVGGLSGYRIVSTCPVHAFHFLMGETEFVVRGE
ncbi:hypothetical protein BH11ARM1_BH11ARM1_04780 [soil metagenome]